MVLIDFIKRESSISIRKLLIFSGVSGLANALLLAIINTAAENSSINESNGMFLILFVITFSLFLFTNKYIIERSNAIAVTIINRIRIRVANKIRCIDLKTFEELGKDLLYTRLTQDANTLSQMAPMMIRVCQSSIMLCFSIIYILIVSPVAFLVVIMAIGAGIALYWWKRKKIERDIKEANEKELDFFRILNDMVSGFKEIKVNQKKSDDLFDEYKEIGQATQELKIGTGNDMAIVISASQTFFYSLIGIITFILPVFIDSHSDVVIKLTAAILFIIGPLDTVVGSMPTFSRAQHAANQIQEMEEQMEEKLDPELAEKLKQNITDIASQDEVPFKESLKLNNLEFNYHSENGFRVGPINLTIPKGELLFVVGGNGSGKSTLLNLLTGLYYPNSGHIEVDGEKIYPSNYQKFRNLFSVVFTEFHLFEKLYGLKDVDQQWVDEFIRLMRLEDKTTFNGKGFSSVNLSTGQRKRLALIVTYLENSELLVFDEVAADQDPEFRKYFYETLLPEMKKNGKTVIAVTHDDHYFHIADRVVKMEYGKMVSFRN